MARSVIRRGRMPPEDEHRIQRCTVCIEEEVEARDVTPHLLTAGILDLEDRQEINYCRTRLDRVRRFVDILILRGPRALPEFIIALEMNGYERVATDLKGSDDKEEMVQRAPVGDRLKKVEDGWDILSRRLTRIESKVEENSDIPANELESVKLELHDLKNELLRKVKSLTKENMRKDEMILNLQMQLDGKIEDLKEAEKRIQILETKIKELEDRMKREHSEVHGKLLEQAQLIDDQHEKLETTGKIIEKQSKSMYRQHQKIQKQDVHIQELKTKSNEQNSRQRATEQSLKQMEKDMNHIVAMMEKEKQDRVHAEYVVAQQSKMVKRPLGGNIVARNRFQTKSKRAF